MLQKVGTDRAPLWASHFHLCENTTLLAISIPLFHLRPFSSSPDLPDILICCFCQLPVWPHPMLASSTRLVVMPPGCQLCCSHPTSSCLRVRVCKETNPVSLPNSFYLVLHCIYPFVLISFLFSLSHSGGPRVTRIYYSIGCHILSTVAMSLPIYSLSHPNCAVIQEFCQLNQVWLVIVM